MKDYTQLLPTGSVVYLNGGKTPMVIIGIAKIITPQNTNRNVYFDYNGAPYPEGLRGELRFFFNHKDIRKVIFRGLDDYNFRQYLEVIEKGMRELEGTYEFGDVFGQYE